ncbi:MAG TPA: hypothetical protein GXX51_02250 [Firmicutes bacterium]|nr:hypothetical protein [Bacillota bacterium]
MAERTKMIHVRMPISLVKALDDLVKRSPGIKSRSKFVTEAVENRLKKERYIEAVKGLAGMITAEEAPYWKDEASIDKWLSSNREADRKASEEKWQA